MIKYLFIFLVFLSVQAAGQSTLPVFGNPEKIENLASDAEESMPIISVEGHRLFFVKTFFEGSIKENSRGQDIWFSKKTENSWQEPTGLFKAANDNGNNAAIGISRDGKRVYTFNSIQTRRKLAKGITYTELQEDSSWSDLKKVEIPGFKVGDGFYSFFVDPDEKVILISMSPSFRIPQEDLFVSIKQEDGSWGKVINLGDSINSNYVESTPFITQDLKTLYFSSDVPGGIGGTDIYVSYRLDETWKNWTKPINLGAPINSVDFDAYLIIDENNDAYFTSNRGETYSDIYTSKLISPFTYTEPPKDTIKEQLAVVKGSFLRKDTSKRPVKLKIFDTYGNFIKDVTTNENGDFEYTKLAAEENYVIKVANSDDGELIDGKMYLVDETGAKTKRLTVLEDGSFSSTAEIKTIKGTFAHKGESKEGVKLNLYDSKGKFIRQVITDKNGEFNYTKLDSQEDFVIKIDEEDLTSFPDAELFIIDPETEAKIPINSKGFADFSFKPTPKVVTGKIVRKVNTAGSVKINIYDENGKFIKQVETNEKGEFEYTKLNAQENYIIQVAEIDGDEMVEGEILLFDEVGAQKSLAISANGTATEYEVESIPELELVISGTANRTGKEVDSLTLILFDEFGFPFDTLLTDKRGEFILEKVNRDEILVIQPVYYSSEEQKETKVVLANNFDFITVGEGILHETLTEKQYPSVVVDEVTTREWAEQSIDFSSNYTLYFGFNEYVMSETLSEELKNIVYRIKSDNKSKIHVEGHTDIIGNPANNLKVSRFRAMAVYNELIRLGIPEDNISVEWAGESSPVENNETEEGRAKNRRVVLSFL